MKWYQIWKERFEKNCRLKMSVWYHSWARFFMWHRLKHQQAHSRLEHRSPVEKKLRWIKLLRILSVLLFVGVMGGIISFVGLFAYFSRDLPRPGQIVRREGFSTKIYDRTGALLYNLFSDERRDPIAIKDAPEYLKQATIAIEDRNFYHHLGFDVAGITRAFFKIFTTCHFKTSSLIATCL